MEKTRIERLARFFRYASDSSDIDLSDDIALDRAYDDALDQLCDFAWKGASLQELIAMEKLISELADLLREASGEEVEHAGRVDRTLAKTKFGYANGRLGPREESGFSWVFSMHGPAR
jgi:hypothetical protein